MWLLHVQPLSIYVFDNSVFMRLAILPDPLPISNKKRNDCTIALEGRVLLQFLTDPLRRYTLVLVSGTGRLSGTRVTPAISERQMDPFDDGPYKYM